MVVFGITIAMALATLIGPLAGGVVATTICFGIAGLLGWLAKREYQRSK